MSTLRPIVTLAWILASSDLAVAQDTTRVSVDSSGMEGDSVSVVTGTVNAMSADGMIVCARVTP